MKKNYFLSVLFLIISLSTFFQVGNSLCNDYSPLNSSLYSMSLANQASFLGDKWSNKNNLIDCNQNNVASCSAILFDSAWIEAQNTSASNFYAGFLVGDLDFVSLGASIKVATYNLYNCYL